MRSNVESAGKAAERWAVEGMFRTTPEVSYSQPCVLPPAPLCTPDSVPPHRERGTIHPFRARRWLLLAAAAARNCV
ncbi:MAG: hypothetical protein EOO65_00640 [Methanosarcinales archaeon]|nr:MAG: hypothetical protein EOO65_00640 [Methanosarcinales archaeon]